MSAKTYRDPNFEAWLDQAMENADWSMPESANPVVNAIRRLRRRGDAMGQSVITRNGRVYPLV